MISCWWRSLNTNSDDDHNDDGDEDNNHDSQDDHNDVLSSRLTRLITYTNTNADDVNAIADNNDDHDDVFGSRFTKEAFVRSCRWPSPNTNGPATAIALCVFLRM